MSTQFSFEYLFGGRPIQPPLTGRELRDSGIEEAIKAAPESWKKRFKSAIENKMIGETFTIEEVVDSLGGRPSDTRPAAIGALTFHLAKKGVHGTNRRNGKSASSSTAQWRCRNLATGSNREVKAMNRNRPTFKQRERMVEKFNRDFPVGAKVILRKGILDEAEDVETTVTAPATIIGFHSAVAWFEGVTGCYDINGRVRAA